MEPTDEGSLHPSECEYAINNSSNEEPNTSELLKHSNLLVSTEERDAELLQHVRLDGLDGGDNDGSVLQALADESSLGGEGAHM